MRTAAFVILSGFLAVPLTFAQFGGRQGDAVILVVSAKGNADFQSVPSTTTNTQTGFVTLDPTMLPDEPFGPDFPSESRRLMHRDPAGGDVFNMIIQNDTEPSPHQFLQGPVKVMIFQGLLRLFPPNEPPVDTPVGFFAPFPDTVDFGPNREMWPGVTLMWTPFPEFPVAKKDPGGYVSPVVPAGSNGIDFLLSLGSFVGIVPWVSFDQKYPGAGWPQGIDIKVIEKDVALNCSWQVIRLRPGRTTPLFRINANTHMWALSGGVTITPAGGTPTVIANPGCDQPCPGKIYSFVPPGFAIKLSNPAVYDGPK